MRPDSRTEGHEPPSPDPAWPAPVEPGPETAALRRFHRDVTWTGVVKAAGGLPEMTAEGSGAFRWTSDGLWVVGDFAQKQFHRGRQVADWSAHYIAGWDFAQRRYVAFAADSNGRCVTFTGVIDGDTFTITSEGARIGGAPVRLRMVWDVSDPAATRWKNEMSVANGPWRLVEEYEMHSR